MNSGDGKPGLSSSMGKQVDQNIMESGSSIFRRLIRRQVAEELPSEVRHLGSARHDGLQEGMTSSGRANGSWMTGSGEFVSDNSSLLSLQPWIFPKENNQVDGEGRIGNNDSLDKYGYGMDNGENVLRPPLSPRNVGLSYGFGRNRHSIRSRRPHRYSVKPLNSVENCLVPHLYGYGFEEEEFVFTPVTSPSLPSRRSLCITDGSRIISKSTFDPLDTCLENTLHGEVNGVSSRETVTGVKALTGPRKAKRKSEQMQRSEHNNSTSRRSQKHTPSRGSINGLHLFSMGICIGVISTIVINRREVEKLNGLLKHNENLVQDLQEELEMKDSLTVNELANEACYNEAASDNCVELQEPVGSPQNHARTLCFTEQEVNGIHHSYLDKSGENSESLSKIEAELEAELERLELNMTASSLEGKMSELDELDPDLIADVVRGELREDMFKQDEPHGDSNEISTDDTHPANFSVSPRELSLRLHELNQSRLEQRIKELETELYHSRKQLQLMEVDRSRTNSLNSNSEIGSSSNQGSPTIMEQGDAMTQPLCLNLSGDALNAYNEAYDEFFKMTEPEDKDKQSSTTNFCGQINGNDSFMSDGNLLWGLEGGRPDFSLQNFDCYERRSPWTNILDKGNNKLDETDEEVENVDDEEGRMLIQQIVERTRQGSSVLLNAQRMLFSMDK